MVSGKETGQTAHPSGPLSLEKRSMSSNQMTVSSTWPSKTTLSATDTRLHRTRNPGFKTPKVKMTPPTDKRTPVFVITVKCRGAAHPCFLYFCYLFKSSVYDLKIINYCYSHYIQWTRFWSKTSRKWYGPYALRKVGRKLALQVDVDLLARVLEWLPIHGLKVFESIWNLNVNFFLYD